MKTSNKPEVADIEQVADLLRLNGHTVLLAFDSAQPDYPKRATITVDGMSRQITSKHLALGTMRLVAALHTDSLKEPPTEYQRLAAAAKRNALADQMAMLLMADLAIPVPMREYIFHPVRKWRMDFAWPRYLVAVEVDGIAWNPDGTADISRHTNPAGYERDAEKGNAAALAGWIVLHYTNRMVTTDAVREIREGLQAHGWLPPDPPESNVRSIRYPAR